MARTPNALQFGRWCGFFSLGRWCGFFSLNFVSFVISREVLSLCDNITDKPCANLPWSRRIIIKVDLRVCTHCPTVTIESFACCPLLLRTELASGAEAGCRAGWRSDLVCPAEESEGVDHGPKLPRKCLRSVAALGKLFPGFNPIGLEPMMWRSVPRCTRRSRRSPAALASSLS